MKKLFYIMMLLAMTHLNASAQIGEYRNRFSVGIGGGYVMNNIGFQPVVVQESHGGMSVGLMGRYTTEKYFSTLCAVQAEVNITKTGWKEKLQTINGDEVINPLTKTAEEYQRDMTYIQIPVFAHLSWGKEKKGVNFFINLGPQFGLFLGENTKCNYDIPFTKKNFPDEYTSATGRVSDVTEQESMPVENKFDYGITAGGGLEVHFNHVGRFNIEGRYYYGLGNIYGDTKRDFFAKSNHGQIFIRLSYLYDL